MMIDKEKKYHTLYMNIAYEVAKMSYCHKLHVGAIAVKDDIIISMGWNGQPTTFMNTCEDDDGKTFDSVLHAESNLLAKLARSNESSSGATIYITHSPCIHCAKIIAQTGVSNVFYSEEYRNDAGLKHLYMCGVEVQQFTP